MRDSSKTRAGIDSSVSRQPANFFPPGLAVRAIQPADNDAVRALFITVQNELAPTDADLELRIAIKRYIDSCLNDDLARASVYYSKPRRRLWVLESQEREIVAMIAIEADENEPGAARLRRLAVARQFRRKGVGRLLVQRTEQWALQQGFGRIALYVSELQPAAQSLYESLGYGRKQAENYGPIAVLEMHKSFSPDAQ